MSEQSLKEMENKSLEYFINGKIKLLIINRQQTFTHSIIRLIQRQQFVKRRKF
jgi:hypothetical protein